MIEARSLSFKYPPLVPQGEGLLVLNGLSLSLRAGERAALMGATGAGKTTLALVLAGLVPATTGGELQGEIRVAGLDVREVGAARLSREVGLVFQEADHQLFNMTVEDEVAFGLEGLSLPPEEIERRVDWVLDRVGLNEQRERAPWQLSGGQQKRLALASMLAMEPTVLLLDEPMAGLDPLGRRAIAELLDELKEEHGTTMLAMEQDAEWVARWAERVLVLHDGRIVVDGPTREVLSQVDLLRSMAVQPPQMAEVAAALHLPGHPLTSTEAAPLVQQLIQNARLPIQNEPQEIVTPLAVVGRRSSVVAVKAEGAHFQYPNGPAALNGLSLEVREGEFVALAGPNGGGKTTFAKHLNGLLRPASGAVHLFGEPTTGRRVGELARQVGYVFQNPDLQIFAVTVRDELAYGPRNLGLSENEVEARVERALERFGLERWADAPPAVLGYGLRRLVSIAAVWTMQPPIWVLDEPTTGLDAALTERLVAEMEALHAAGHTLLLITHDLRLVAALAERLVIIAEGRVALDGPPRAVLSQAGPLRPFGLRPPPVTRLAGKVRGLPDDLLTVDELLEAVGRNRAL
ncbi:MAG TPA: ABC transporter ATP-binding protein [Ardenticatenaceae bacterium]